VSGGEKMGLAVQTLTNEVLLSSEFKNVQRRISHLFTMYGFIVFVVSTAVLIFGYPTAAEAGIWPVLWHLGALSIWPSVATGSGSRSASTCRLRARSGIDCTQGDIFIVSLLAMVTFGLLWSFTGPGALDTAFFVLFILSSTTLFSTVLWSKFAHMFFKPAAAFQKKVTKADGSPENLPDVPTCPRRDQDTLPGHPRVHGRQPAVHGARDQARATRPTTEHPVTDKVRRGN
jgi:hypothetical protein